MTNPESQSKVLIIPKNWEECVISGLSSSNPQLIRMMVLTFCEGDNDEEVISNIKEGTDELRILNVKDKKVFERYIIDFAEKRQDVKIVFHGGEMAKKKEKIGIRKRISSLLPRPISG